MIIDAHMHLGEDLMFNTNDSEETILSYMQEYSIDGAILQTGMVTYDIKAANLRIYDFIKKHPGKFWGIAALSPYMPESEYVEFAKWTIRDLGFKGIKLHTAAFCCSPISPQAEKVFDTAAMLNVPVMIHTGNGIPNALPSLAIPIARRYPDMKIILAHAGGGMFGGDALVAAMECSNIYLETSWAFSYDLKTFSEKLGCHRIMFGTDLPINAGAEIGKYRGLHLTNEQYEQCFCKTAMTVFNL